MQKRVAILLVNWNSFEVTGNCIRSLMQADCRDHAVIVIDNGSEDMSGARLKETFPHIILLQASENLGFSGGNNLGIRYAIENNYAYVLLLNNDTLVDKGFLEPLIHTLDNDLSAGAVQPIIFFEHNRSLIWNAGSFYHSWLGRAYTRGYYKTKNDTFSKPGKVDWITGCAMLVRTEVFLQTGLLNESFFMYYEDVDLSFRIRKAGFTLSYMPDSVIYHIAGMSNKKKEKDREGLVNPVVHYLNTRNRIWLLKKYTSIIYIPAVFLYTGFYITGSLLYFLVRGRLGKFGSVLKGVRDGILLSMDRDKHQIVKSQAPVQKA